MSNDRTSSLAISRSFDIYTFNISFHSLVSDAKYLFFVLLRSLLREDLPPKNPYMIFSQKSTNQFKTTPPSLQIDNRQQTTILIFYVSLYPLATAQQLYPNSSKTCTLLRKSIFFYPTRLCHQHPLSPNSLLSSRSIIK